MDKAEAIGPPVLDVRDVALGQRHPKIFQLFNQLSEGDAFTLINDHDPKPLLYQLQFEQENTFEWWPLEEGPDEWRIQIAKRTQQSGDDRTITDFLQTDHARLDSLFTRCAKLVDGLQLEDKRESNVIEVESTQIG